MAISNIERFKIDHFLKRISSISDPNFIPQEADRISHSVYHSHYHEYKPWGWGYFGPRYSAPSYASDHCYSRSGEREGNKKNDKSELIIVIGIIGIIGTIGYMFYKIDDYFKSIVNHSNTQDIETISEKHETQFFSNLSKLAKDQKDIDAKRKKRESFSALASGVSLASFSSITYGGFKENDLLVKLGAAGAIASISFGILNHFLLKGDLIKQEVQQDYNTKVAKDLLPMLKKTPSQIAPPKQENN